MKSTGGSIPLGKKLKWKLTSWCCCARLGLTSMFGFIKPSRVLSSMFATDLELSRDLGMFSASFLACYLDTDSVK